MTIKEKLHQLVEDLPDAELHAAERYLEFLAERGDRVPNETTRRTFADTDAGRDLVRSESAEEMFSKLGL